MKAKSEGKKFGLEFQMPRAGSLLLDQPPPTPSASTICSPIGLLHDMLRAPSILGEFCPFSVPASNSPVTKFSNSGREGVLASE